MTAKITPEEAARLFNELQQDPAQEIGKESPANEGEKYSGEISKAQSNIGSAFHILTSWEKENPELFKAIKSSIKKWLLIIFVIYCLYWGYRLSLWQQEVNNEKYKANIERCKIVLDRMAVLTPSCRELFYGDLTNE